MRGDPSDLSAMTKMFVDQHEKKKKKKKKDKERRYSPEQGEETPGRKDHSEYKKIESMRETINNLKTLQKQ